MSILIFTALMLAAVASPEVSSQRFILEMPVSPDTSEGRELIARRALELCGGGYPELGHFTYTGLEKVGGPSTFKVDQEYVCRDAPPPKVEYPAADPNWQPTPDDESRIREATLGYFTLYDSGDSAAVHALWSSDNQTMQPLEQRTVKLRESRQKEGKPISRRIAKLTWYVNPAGAPKPGIYVAADYEKAYSEVNLVCGYVIWFRKLDGSYELTREETTRLEKTDQDPLSSEKRAEMRAVMRCPPEGG